MYLLLNHRLWWSISWPLIWLSTHLTNLSITNLSYILYLPKENPETTSLFSWYCNDYPFPFSFIYALFNTEILTHLIILKKKKTPYNLSHSPTLVSRKYTLFRVRMAMGQGWRMGSSSPLRMILFCPISVPPCMTGKIFLPHPYPLGPYKAPPHLVKLYFLLICPQLLQFFF